MTQKSEMKVPNGKLLRADVRAADTIEAVELHGDFFIYPEEALNDIEDALIGAPQDSTADDLERQVRQALDENTELVGFQPVHVAEVVQKTLDGDTDEE